MGRGRRTPAPAYDLVIVGMGSAGVIAAEAATALGLRTAAVERGRVGGDCLWTGCVPSKALLASARIAQHVRAAREHGITTSEPVVDTARVLARVRGIQDRIAATDDDPDRFRRMGIDVRLGHAAVLAGPHAVRAGDAHLTARHILLCTGSRPAVPDLPGLHEAGFLTSETVWDLPRAPASLVVLGGGPVGVELAQAFSRLGVDVTLLQRGPRLLPRDEPELAERLATRLGAEGVDVRLDTAAERVETAADGRRTVHATRRGEPLSFTAEAILVAAGRTPHVEELGLEALGIAVGPAGIETDDHGRTAVPSISAVGDAVGRHRYTHTAATEAAQAVRDRFLPGRGQVAQSLVPWCTFTEPELAHVGATISEAVARHGGEAVEVHRIDLAHSDRARADGTEDGRLVVVAVRGRIAGASVLAPAAGEVVHELALAIRRRMRLTDLAGLVHVYPTVSTSVAQVSAAAAFAQARRFRRLVRR